MVQTKQDVHEPDTVWKVSRNYDSQKSNPNLLSNAVLKAFLPFNHSGGYNEEATPVPIPNTVVKLFGADNTWLETAWEDRALPDLIFLLSSVG